MSNDRTATVHRERERVGSTEYVCTARRGRLRARHTCWMFAIAIWPVLTAAKPFSWYTLCQKMLPRIKLMSSVNGEDNVLHQGAHLFCYCVLFQTESMICAPNPCERCRRFGLLGYAMVACVYC